jgi:hypothetical protein
VSGHDALNQSTSPQNFHVAVFAEKSGHALSPGMSLWRDKNTQFEPTPAKPLDSRSVESEEFTKKKLKWPRG